MKWISFLILIFLFLFSCTSFAADRWQFIVSNTSSDYSFDTQSIKYTNLPDSTIIDKSGILVNVKRVYSMEMKQHMITASAETTQSEDAQSRIANAAYAVDEDLYDITHNSFKKYSVYYYDKNNNLSHRQYYQTQPIVISPNSIEEKVFKAIAIYVKDHDEEIEARSKGLESL
ncbi:MAG: hypothetical protein WCS30_00950 [Selenomonadaceae bacterium]